MRTFGLGMLSVAALACGEPTRFVPAAWPPDQSKVLIVIDAQLGPESVRAFGPAEPIVLEVGDNRPKRLLVYAYETPATPELDPVTCGVVLDDSNPVVLPFEGAFETQTLDLGSSEQLQFARVDPASSELPKVGYLSCISDRVSCARLESETFRAPSPDRDAERIAVISDDVIFFAASGDLDTTPTPDTYLFRFDRTQGDDASAFRQLAAPTSTTSHISSLAYDGESVLATTKDGQLLRYDPTSGDLLSQGPAPGGLSQLSYAAGVTLYFGARGLLVTGAAITPITDVAVHDAVVVDSTRALAITARGLQLWDGQSWQMQPGPEPPYNQVTVAADLDVLVAVTERGRIFERVGDAPGWDLVEPPPGALHAFTSLSPLSEGRYLIGGKAGLLYLRNKVGLCQLPLIANNVRDIALSPSGRSVWVGSSNLAGASGDLSPIVRITLP